MKFIITALLTFILTIPAVAQEKKVFLNFFSGVATFTSDIEYIAGDDFQSNKLYSAAPTGMSLGVEFLKNTYVDIHFGTQRLHNDYLRVADEYGSGVKISRMPVVARNFGIKLKYEMALSKSLKLIPFFGYSVSFINQPANSITPLQMRLKSSSTSAVNGVVTDVRRDSLFSSTEFLTNSFSGINAGGELLYEFKNKLGLYLSYAFFYSAQYYAMQYGEYRSTAGPTQKANAFFGKSGHFYQIGLRYRIFEY